MSFSDLAHRFPEDLVFVQDQNGMGISAYRSIKIVTRTGVTTIYKDYAGKVHREFARTDRIGFSSSRWEVSVQ